MKYEIISKNEEDQEEDQIDRLRLEVAFKNFYKALATPALFIASTIGISAESKELNFYTLFPSLSPEGVLFEGAIAVGAISVLYQILKGNQAQRELDRLQSPAIPIID